MRVSENLGAKSMSRPPKPQPTSAHSTLLSEEEVEPEEEDGKKAG